MSNVLICALPDPLEPGVAVLEMEVTGPAGRQSPIVAFEPGSGLVFIFCEDGSVDLPWVGKGPTLVRSTGTTHSLSKFSRWPQPQECPTTSMPERLNGMADVGPRYRDAIRVGRYFGILGPPHLES